MFERFTERARRVLFFARFEASQLGSSVIESEHLLLGLVREGKGVTSRLFADHKVSLVDVRREPAKRRTSTRQAMACSWRSATNSSQGRVEWPIG